MHRGPEHILFPRRHTGGWQKYEKKKAQLHYLLGKCKTTMRYYLTCVRLLIINKTIASVGEIVEKNEPSLTAGENVNWYSHYGK